MEYENIEPVKILIVDDDDVDVELILMHLKQDRVANKVSRVCDGMEAMEFLKQTGEFASAERPDIIFLDLNMPRMGGHEVLKQCDQDPDLRSIPIVVFTSSNDERDILSSYEYKASSYITKPVSLEKFRDVLRDLGTYWFCVVKLPKN